MDADGFIPVTLIASFHRVRSLTTDINLVICSIKQSEHLELVDGFKVSFILYCNFLIFLCIAKPLLVCMVGVTWIRCERPGEAVRAIALPSEEL